MGYEKGMRPNLSVLKKWRNFIILSIIASVGLLKTPNLNAVIYQWIDENGVRRFSNSPPDNDAEFKKLFDAYEYDKAADLERMKIDQRKIDALEKQLEEEAKVIEQESEKVIESQQNDPPWFVGGCFSPSISIQQGRGVSEILVPRALSEREYAETLNILSGLNGTWSGNAKTVFCDQYGGKVIEKPENFTIRSNCRMNSAGEFVLESELYSRENRVNTNQKIRLYLKKDHLSTRPGAQEADILVLSVSSDELIYLQKTNARSGGIYAGRLNTIETLWVIKKRGGTSFSLQTFKFLNGKLVQKSDWHQKQR